MARPLKPFIRGGGYYPSNKWIPLVYNGGYTTMNGGEEPEPPTPVYWKTITGVSPLVLASAMQEHIRSLTQYGKCEQPYVPTPTAPADVVCNNGALKCSMNMANVNEQTALVGYYISAQGVVTADSNNWMYQSYIPVKPNTTYTLSFSQSVYYVSISEYSTAEDSGFIVRKAGTTGSNTSLTITTGETTNFIRFGTNIDRQSVTLERVLAINWMLNIGDTAMDYQPYVEGGIYVGGTHPGKNLYNPASACLFHMPIGFSDGSASASWPNAEPETYPDSITYFMRVKPNTTYTYSCATAGDRFGVAGENSVVNPSDYTTASKLTFDSVLVSLKSSGVRKTYTFTTDANTQMIAVYCALNTVPTDIQIEEGATATAYEAYAETPYTPEVLTVSADGAQTQTITDISMLLSVGDVKDELELISGHADRAIVAFRVSPDLTWLLASGTGYKQFYTSDTQGQLKNSVSCMSNIAPYGCTASNRASYQFGCYTGGTGNLCFQMIGEASLSTVDAWKEFLRTNGVYVVAAKATATTEQITPHSLHSYEGTTVVEADTNVDPVTLSVEYASSEE